MKHRFSAAVAGVGTLATAAGIVLVSSTAAFAATVPYEPDSHSVGTIAFYDGTGHQITSGNISDAPFAAYAVGSALPHAGDNQAKLVYAQPDPTKAETANWGVLALSATANTIPVTGGNVPPNTAATPTVVLSAADSTLENDIASAPNTGGTAYQDGVVGCAAGLTAAACSSNTYANLYQIRLLSTNGSADSSSYDVADISVDPATDAWTQVYPTVKTSTTTTVTAVPSSIAANQTVLLTATEAPAVAGSIAFTYGASNTPLGGGPVSGTGVASFTVPANTFTAGTSPTITATFTPTDTTNNGGSVGTTPLTVTAPAITTTTSLGIAGNATTGTAATLSGNVTATGGVFPAGTVTFTDSASNGATAAVVASATVSTTDGSYSSPLAAGFTAGHHSVVASFAPTSATYASSASAPIGFTTVAGVAPGGACSDPASQCTDTQTIQGEIPVGTLVISTPYGGNNPPLDVGTLGLSADGTYYTKSATFRCISVTDTASGGPFVASAIANPLTQVAGSGSPGQPASAVTTINGENIGLDNYVPSTGTCPDGTTPHNSFVGPVTPTNQVAAKGVGVSDGGTAGLGNAAHVILSGPANQTGTATYDGTLTFNAPTSTAAGTYTGTILFTVSN
jgi:hypothetical protein